MKTSRSVESYQTVRKHFKKYYLGSCRISLFSITLNGLYVWVLDRWVILGSDGLFFFDYFLTI